MAKDSTANAKARDAVRALAVESYFAFIEWPVMLHKRSRELDKHLAVMTGDSQPAAPTDAAVPPKNAPARPSVAAQVGKPLKGLDAPSAAPAAIRVSVEQPTAQAAPVAVDVRPDSSESDAAVTDFLGDFLSA